MSKQYEQLASQSEWVSWNEDSNLTVKKCWQKWIARQESLTQALKNLSKDSFEVRPLKQCIALPHEHEREVLTIKEKEEQVVREVELLVDDNAVVFARSIAPLGLEPILKALSNQPLGELLFSEAQEYFDSRQYNLYEYEKTSCFARRTRYKLHGETILVSEFFLPPFMKMA